MDIENVNGKDFFFTHVTNIVMVALFILKDRNNVPALSVDF